MSEPGIRHRKRKDGSIAYQVRVYGPDGERTPKTFDRKIDAVRFKRAMDADRDRGVFLDPRGQEVPFDEWARSHLQGRHDLRDSTRATDASYARRHVLPYFGRTPLGRITPLIVQSWVGELSDSLSPKTVRECYRLLSGIMRAAVDARLIAQSPCRGIKKPRVPRREQRFLTSDEVERLADALDAYYQPLLFSAVYLGARWGELVGLKREHLDLLHRRAFIVGSLEEVGGRVRWLPETKSGASRRVLSVPAFLAQELDAHLSVVPPSEFVFTSKRGHPLRRSSFRSQVWVPAVKSAGLSPLRFHDLRHTCASLLIAEGAHPKEIQARLGHSSISTTLNVYGHLFPSLDERLAERLDATYRAARGDTGGTRSDSTVVELDAVKTESSL